MGETMEKTPLDLIQKAIAEISAGNHRVGADTIAAAIRQLDEHQTRRLIFEINSMEPELFHFATDLFFTSELASVWFHEPAHGLSWQRPCDIIRADPYRANTVLERIARRLSNQDTADLPDQGCEAINCHLSGQGP